MTTNAMIFRKNDLVLAADVAMTNSDEKAYSGVRKIFKLDENLSAGVMINGLIEFEGITMETLIKQFKREENFKDIKTIEEIKNRFIGYLSRNTDHTGINEYLKPIINNFKHDLYLKINESSFEHVMNNHERKEIQDFLKEYENFSNEFHKSYLMALKKTITIKGFGKYFHMNCTLKELELCLQVLIMETIIHHFLKSIFTAMMMAKLSMKILNQESIQLNP